MEKLAATKLDQPVIFDQVLLVEDGEKISIGAPLVKGAKVEAEFIATDRAAKVTVFKYKAKTRYRLKRGHRQPYTKVKITKIGS